MEININNVKNVREIKLALHKSVNHKLTTIKSISVSQPIKVNTKNVNVMFHKGIVCVTKQNKEKVMVISDHQSRMS